jgi:hypothetical protein
MIHWGYFAGSIPSDVDEVVTIPGEHWYRVGPRSWRQEGEGWDAGPGPRMHEGWLLANGPVRYPNVERLMARRDDRLMDQLSWADPVEMFVTLPDSRELVYVDDAMELMRAGWLAWDGRRRRAELEPVAARQRERVEVGL